MGKLYSDDHNYRFAWFSGSHLVCRISQRFLANLALLADKETVTFRQKTKFKGKTKYYDTSSLSSLTPLPSILSLGSGVLDARRLLDRGIKVGLGTGTYLSLHMCIFVLSLSLSLSLSSTSSFLFSLLSPSPSQNPLIQAVVTPCFAPSCSRALLRNLGKLAAEYDVPIQSHMCESLLEIEFTRKLFPEHETTAELFRKAGLLTSKVRMCIYMQ